MTSMLRHTSAFTAHEKPVTGDMKMSFVGSDHLGWIKCDGRSLSKTQYALLYNVIGYQFGGSGASFYLPNPAGGVVGVVGQRSTLVTTTLHGPGSEVGEETHTLLYTEMPAHNHDVAGRVNNLPYSTINGNTSFNSTAITVVDPQHRHTGITDAAGYATTGVNVNNLTTQLDVADNNAGGHQHTFTTNNNSTGITLVDPTHRHVIASNGGDQPHNNMQPTLFMGNVFIYSGLPAQGYYPGEFLPNMVAINPPLI